MSKTVQLRSFGGRRNRVVLEEFGESRTVQADAERTDIRNILERARRNGGTYAYMTAKQGFYADISEAPSYIEALNVVARAQQQFELLPADIRDRFNNDPAKFLAFANDEKNAEELVKLGLRKAPVIPEEPKPIEVRVVPDKAPEGTPPKSS